MTVEQYLSRDMLPTVLVVNDYLSPLTLEILVPLLDVGKVQFYNMLCSTFHPHLPYCDYYSLVLEICDQLLWLFKLPW